MRTKLFVPGSRPEWFAKAMDSEADAVSFDLADAVDGSRKVEARTAVREFLRSLPKVKPKTTIVRVNPIGSPHFEADVEAIGDCGLDMVNLPCVESAEDLQRAAPMTRGTPILANIETAKGLRLCAEIAAHPQVAGLQLGLGDLFEPLAIDRHTPAIVLQIQLAMRLAAGEAGVFAYDCAYADIDDLEGLKREAQSARSLGYLGKSAIHPRQLPVINAVFRPDTEEISHARGIVASAEEAHARGVGAWTVDGKMVDAPFVVRARNTLALAERLGLL